MRVLARECGRYVPCGECPHLRGIPWRGRPGAAPPPAPPRTARSAAAAAAARARTRGAAAAAASLTGLQLYNFVNLRLQL